MTNIFSNIAFDEVIKHHVLPHYSHQIVSDKSCNITLLGNGHINHTYLVSTPINHLVLQQLNTQIFNRPQLLVENSQIIFSELSLQVKSGKYQLLAVAPLSTKAAVLGLDLGANGYWRALSYVTDSYSLEVVENIRQAYVAAKAFGHFANALSAIDAHKLHQVIPNLHHLAGRVEQLKQAIKNDKSQRLMQSRDWVDYILEQQWLMDEIANIAPTLPIRVCHNDTKVNNLLFDTLTHEPKAIIDLDTCMAGHLMYDFGDMVRTFCSPEAEDSRNLSNVKIRPKIFNAICQGYLSELEHTVTEQELKSFWLGACAMCLMLGVRFLTDFLEGDVYFKTHRKKQNFDRAINQLTLFKSLLSQEIELKKYLKL